MIDIDRAVRREMSEWKTVYCGQCDRKDCGRHYIHKEKCPWRDYKGCGTIGLRGYDGCCDYESPSKTKMLMKRHLKVVKTRKQICALKDKIRLLREHIDEL